MTETFNTKVNVTFLCIPVSSFSTLHYFYDKSTVPRNTSVKNDIIMKFCGDRNVSQKYYFPLEDRGFMLCYKILFNYSQKASLAQAYFDQKNFMTLCALLWDFGT